MKLGLLVWKTSPSCKATVWQGSSTAHTYFLTWNVYICIYIYMYIIYIYIIFIFSFLYHPISLILGCGQCRALGPDMVIWISPARMGKLFELGFAGIYNVFFWKFVILKRKKPERATFPDQTATFRDRRLYPTNVFGALFPIGAGAYSSWSPSNPKFKHVHAGANSCNCNKPVCDSWG